MADKTFRNLKNVKNTIKLLKILTTVLDKHQIRYYLDFGTLIGAMRDNSLIPWDDDIDISLIDEDDYKKIPLVLKEMKKKYWYRTYLFTFDNSLKKYKKKHPNITLPTLEFTNLENYQIAKIRDHKFLFFGRGNSCIDIFFKYNYKNHLYWFAFGEINKISDIALTKGLIKIDFYGISCSIPKDYDTYLTSIYGDWKTPNESWVESDMVTS